MKKYIGYTKNQSSNTISTSVMAVEWYEGDKASVKMISPYKIGLCDDFETSQEDVKQWLVGVYGKKRYKTVKSPYGTEMLAFSAGE